MRVVVITQDEPFYLAKNFNYLLKILPKHSKVVGCVVASVSPFGKQESFLKKIIKTYRIFGIKFFLYYSTKYFLNTIFSNNSFLKVLMKNDIPFFKLKGSINSEENLKKINSFKPDILVSILGNQLFKAPLINLTKFGCLNLHSALLPKYRGLMPTFWVLKNQEDFTGVSVFFVDEGIDSGPIVVQKKIKIKKRIQKNLIEITKKLGMEAISEAIDLIEKGKVSLIKNDKELSTYFKFPSRNDVVEFYKSGNKFF